MRYQLFACAAVLVTASASAATQAEPRPDGTVVRIEATAGDHAAQGTAFLIHAVPGPKGEATLYFLTAAHLFVSTADVQPSGPVRARLFVADNPTLDVGGERIVFPPDGARVGNLAIVRASGPAARMVPVPITVVAPDPGDVFVIVGHQSDGKPKVLTERVRFQSTRFVVGDRTAPDVEAFTGAPAFGAGGVFGFVSEFSSARVPIVTLIGPAAAFISRSVPGWGPRSSGAPEFQLVQRMVKGPVLQVGCDAVSAGELEVPVEVGLHESLVDAQATMSGTTAVRLADVTVLALQDRTVRLRFTMVGIPPPAFPAAFPPPCQQGQALVTVAVNVVVFPRE
ncbi:MAG: hypothetical protein ACM3SQ_20460 [Betaproteobacteria bacterium]